jgi:hypothetical protein
MSDQEPAVEVKEVQTPPVVERYQYQLTIRIPIEAIDNIEARQIAKGYLDAAAPPKDATVKLQRLEVNKAPTGVTL